MIMALDCRKKLFQVFENGKILQITDSEPSSPPGPPPAILMYFVPSEIFAVHDAPESACH